MLCVLEIDLVSNLTLSILSLSEHNIIELNDLVGWDGEYVM